MQGRVAQAVSGGRHGVRTRLILAMTVAIGCVTPLPVNAQSDGEQSIGWDALPVRVMKAQVPLFDAPSGSASRRGTLARGTPTFLHAEIRGSGCSTRWALVGASAWACELPGTFASRDRSDLSTEPAPAIEFARIEARGAVGYRSIESLAEQLPDAELQPGFMIGFVEQRTLQGEGYGRTTHGIWIAKRDVVPLEPSMFQGVQLQVEPPPEPSLSTTLDESPQLPHGWVFVERATPRRTPNGPALATRPTRLAHLRVLKRLIHTDRHAWYQTEVGWLSDRDLRVPNLVPPPSEIGATERWLDIDRRTQTLIAYSGRTPVFATLVSTGRGLDQGPLATPAGLHRIWVKLASTDMDNLEQLSDPTETSSPAEPYAVEAVPFVAFFLRGYGLHATYWHDAFGTPRSHGCVNLSIHDAAWIFEFVGPSLPPGWQAVHPDRYDSGTLVRVR